MTSWKDNLLHLWTDNVFTYDMEKLNLTDKWRNILLINLPQTFPEEQKEHYRRERGVNDLKYTDQHTYF